MATFKAKKNSDGLNEAINDALSASWSLRDSWLFTFRFCGTLKEVKNQAAAIRQHLAGYADPVPCMSVGDGEFSFRTVSGTNTVRFVLTGKGKEVEATYTVRSSKSIAEESSAIQSFLERGWTLVK